MSDVNQLIAGAVQHWQRGMVDQAQSMLKRALDAYPWHAQANELYARLLAGQGQWEQAASHLERAIEAAPSAGLYFALGSVKGNTRDAEGAIAAFRKASELQPRNAEFLMPLGFMLAERGQSDEAEGILRRALELAPTSGDVIGALAAVLTGRAKSEEAVNLLGRGATANPQQWVLIGNLCQTMNYVAVDPAEALGWRRRFGELLRSAPPLIPGSVPHTPDPRRKLRIGYLSPDLRHHPVTRFLEPALRHHNQDQFEVFCYHTGVAEDATTQRLRTLVRNWRQLAPIADADLLNVIRRDMIDVLIELSGHTSGHRLAVLAQRAAPVQVTYIGCPSSTGLPAIDCRIVDAITDPPGSESQANERLERLPGCFLCFNPPEDSPDPVEARAAAGGERPITFGSFNNLAKLSPETVALWSRVLQAVPDSRLCLKGMSLRESSVRGHIVERFERSGVEASRIECLPETPVFTDHLASYGRMDIALDTTPYNGTTTTCEALWMGVPVVALRGSVHAARVSASLLAAAGLPELVAETWEQFVDIATRLAADRAALEEQRRTLRHRVRASRLCDAPTHARALESAYRRMWEAWCAPARRAN